MLLSTSQISSDHENFKALNANICFMSCGNTHHDFVLLQHFDDQGMPVAVDHHGLVHVAFENEEGRSLDEFANGLENKGIKSVPKPIMHSEKPRGDGTWGGNYSIYFQDPDGHTIEVYSGMDEFIADIDQTQRAAPA
jgi:catechol-2,3-dioxygenase